MYYLYLYIILCSFVTIITPECVKREAESNSYTILNDLPNLVKYLPPDLRGKRKGESGRLCLIAGSVQHAGAPYFAAISALKAGADNVYVVTPKATAPIVKAYSPDPLVYPYFNHDTVAKIYPIVNVSDLIIIGPGLGKEEETLTLIYDIINTCKMLEKPIVVDADGLYALSKNPTILKNYPGPVILTPNNDEAERLIKGMVLTNDSQENWYDYWGGNVSVLLKGDTDYFYCNKQVFNWYSNEGGSNRRCPGQGDILAGALGTFLNWALKTKVFVNDKPNYPCLSQTIASFAAAKFTRYSNSRAFQQYGRTFLGTNMIENLHLAFRDVFES